MRPLRLVGLIAQSLLYVGSGINHFAHADFYLKIMPDHYAHPDALVQLSGVFEILGGLGLLLPFTRRFSAAGIMAMLVVFFDVHIFMLTHASRFAGVPLWALWVRIPLQFALIWWAWLYARRGEVTGD
jgi:uncharacterized membrane protein